MNVILSRSRSSRALLGVFLGATLFFVYLLTFSGNAKSGDELFIIDTTDSFAVRSGPDRLLLNETVYLRGLQTTDVEPAQPLLATPLYWIAYHIPWIGNVHAIFLFNPLITALTSIVLFYFALDLGYEERTAIIGSLLFGLTTIAWPYSKTFFREPLTTLNLLGAAFLLNRWRVSFRDGVNRSGVWFTLGLVTVIIAILSKEAALVALPFLMLLAYPGKDSFLTRRQDWARIVIIIMIIVFLLVTALIIYRSNFEALAQRYEVQHRWDTLLDGLPTAWYHVLGYLFSPARGVFWYSPILILAVGAPFILPRNRWRETWLPLAMTITFAAVYAAVRGELWHGGVGWGGRYLVPATPFLLLGSLPLLDLFLRDSRKLTRIMLGLLVGMSLMIQIGGAYVNLTDFYGYQQAQTQLVPWNDQIIWSVVWSQAIGSLMYLSNATPDILWLMHGPDWLSFAALSASIGLSITGLVWIYRRKNRVRPHPLMLSLIGLIGSIGVVLLVLARAYPDSRMEGHNQDLHALRSSLGEQLNQADTILLTTPRYVPYFMNYYKFPAIWYSLPLSPGERYSCEDPIRVVSSKLNDQIDEQALGMFQRISIENDRPVVWLVVDNGPQVPCATRPVEHYFAESAFLVSATDFSPLVRLDQFLLLPLPSKSEPTQPLESQFGDHIHLLGYDIATNLPNGNRRVFQPGDLLGVSLVWEATETLETNYTFAMYLINENGEVVLQQDREPVAGFSPTTTWIPNERLRDNYGFVLPESLPSGTYELWVVIYSWPSLERLPVAGSDGVANGDHVVLSTITIR
jgi:hypothetical protein